MVTSVDKESVEYFNDIFRQIRCIGICHTINHLYLIIHAKHYLGMIICLCGHRGDSIYFCKNKNSMSRSLLCNIFIKYSRISHRDFLLVCDLDNKPFSLTTITPTGKEHPHYIRCIEKETHTFVGSIKSVLKY